MLGYFKIKKLRTIFIIYWFLLGYIIAALIYWFILLNQQNNILTDFKILQVGNSKSNSGELLTQIAVGKKRKEIQYFSEGAIFLLLIITGAILVYRAVRRQLKLSQLQHNFMMALTHELKTPIAITKLNLETLKKRTLTNEVQQKLISNTLQEANRLNDLCSNMLLASQLEAGGYQFTYEDQNFSEIVVGSVSEYKNRFPERNFLSDIDAEIFLRCDKLLIQIAVNNIIDNALKYSGPGDSINIELKQSDKNFVLKIADQGKGIPDAEKEKIFNKFYRLGNQSTREAKGTGIGLYLSRTIVQENNGKLEVFNNNPSGSIFQFTFAKS